MAGMMVQVNDVVFRPREVELPEACPDCGAVLAEVGVTEQSWNNAAVDGTVQDGAFEGGGSTEFGDRYEVRGYECGACHREVVFGNETFEVRG